VVHHRGEVRPTDHDARIIYLTDAQIFNEVDHQKDTTRGLIPGNLDLKKIRTVREVRSYRRYIWIEYDVFCTCDLREALSFLIKATDGADFAASFITYWKDDGWMWWESLKIPPQLRQDAHHIAVRAFLPLFVFSKRYIDCYEDQMKLGWAGHSEVTMSTVASVCGFDMKDLSRSNPPFTHNPQFAIKEVSKLDECVPLFVHPVKTPESRSDIRRKLESLGDGGP
jgi:hypothetical protein